MPIVVDPGFSWPPEVDPVVSPDGKLTAIVDPAHAGVLLRADFDDSVPDTPAQPEKVLRRNINPDPVGTGSKTIDNYRKTGNDTMTFIVNDGGRPAIEMTEGDPINTTLYIDPTTNFNESHGLAVGKWIALGVDVKAVNGFVNSTSSIVRIMSYNGGALSSGANPSDYALSGSEYKRLTVARQITAMDSNSYFRTLVWPSAPTAPGQGFRFRNFVVALADDQAEALEMVSTFFDGSTPQSGKKRYRWTGTANASASEEFTPATPFVPGHGATVAKVRFERQDGSVVRSGNPAWAPGGYAHAYDHEATLGGGTLWRAVPIRFDGTEGTPSEYVGAVIPAPSDGWAWLKPVTDPDKAMLLKVEPPDLSYDGRVDTTSIAGAPRPAATWDVLEGFTTQLRSLVREKDVEQQLMALLDEGPVLAQFPACAGLPDFYFIRGKLDLEHVHWDGWPWRRYQWDVIQVDRPDTTDSSLRIPGLSYDTVERDWTTYDQLAATVESYNKLLEP